VAGGRKALSDDQVVWEHIDCDMVPRFDEQDQGVQLFREFCREFAPMASP
jgi:hypothetical protein